MRKALRVVAWIGVGIIILGTPLSFSFSSSLMSIGPMGIGVAWWGFTWILGTLGTVLLLVGGFIAKPRYLWIGAIVVGLLYISSFYGGILWWVETNKLARGLAVSSPGLACIIGGIVMWRLSRRSSEAI